MLRRTAIRVAVLIAMHTHEWRRRQRARPDAGSESVDKILWTAVIVVVVGVIGKIFQAKLTAFANSLSFTLTGK